MGNRGRIHRVNRTLKPIWFASYHWICCQIDYKGRHRNVWGDGYTELFFLDEVTAFAAGHRPCFECRRKDAEAFAALFSGKQKRASAPAMDKVLHAERLDGKSKRLHKRKLDTLPDGAMIVRAGHAFAVRGKHLLPWTPLGYGSPVAWPRGDDIDVLTPPSIVAVLAAGYTPLWHPSGEI
jgi:hypothetical protein